MNINRIEGKDCKNTRSLWEEVFYEDPVHFTDYYFENKAEKNIGYVLGQAPYNAMMFRTPYLLQIGEQQKEISYIVGVATRKECRHRGYMRKLLMHSFQEMYEEKQPFTFLMPADPAIYEPFDFKYVYERDVWTLKEPEKGIAFLESLTFQETEKELTAAEVTDGNFSEYGTRNIFDGLYSVRSLKKRFPKFQINQRLAEFANSYLKEHYHIYVCRDVAYYEMQLKESEAQNGDIYVWFEQGEIKAFFLYAREEGEVFIQEVMEAEEGCLDFLQRSEKKKPIIMARIIHLEEMMKLICIKEHGKLTIKIEDELIPENAGIYQWEMGEKGSRVTKIQAGIRDRKKDLTDLPEISMHIRDFTTWILSGVFINEIV